MKSELLLNKILNTTSTCIFWKDDQRRFVGVNQAFLDYYGFSSESELIGKTDEDMNLLTAREAFFLSLIANPILRYAGISSSFRTT